MKQRRITGTNFFTYFDRPVEASKALFVTTVGNVSIGPHEIYPYNREEHPKKYTINWDHGRILDEFQFLYISEGSGRLRSFEGDFFLRPGSLISLVPGEKHRYAPDQETGWTEYWLGFTGATPNEWIEQGLLEKTITKHDILNQKEMLFPFCEALDFVQNRRYCVQPLLVSCITRIFAYLVENRHIQLERIGFDVIEKSKKIFEKNIFQPMEMEELTGSLNINYQQLREQFRKKTGLSPYQYFLQMKINKAKELLLEGTLSIKEISYKLSFDSPYYFSRLFKKKVGVSPSKWSNTTSPKDLDLWLEHDG